MLDSLLVFIYMFSELPLKHDMLRLLYLTNFTTLHLAVCFFMVTWSCQHQVNNNRKEVTDCVSFLHVLSFLHCVIQNE